jgi:hypothetical protein
VQSPLGVLGAFRLGWVCLCHNTPEEILGGTILFVYNILYGQEMVEMKENGQRNRKRIAIVDTYQSIS